MELWRPEGLVRRLGIGPRSRKWLGYIDQFVLFPLSATMRLRHMQGAPLVVLGDRLGLYKTMAAAGPCTSAELAAAEEAARVAKAKAERARIMGGVHLRQECIDNPLAKGCN